VTGRPRSHAAPAGSRFSPRAPGCENRIAEPAANPYLYYASQIHAGLDGLRREFEPPAPYDAPYETEAPSLPANLTDAIALTRTDEALRKAFGDRF